MRELETATLGLDDKGTLSGPAAPIFLPGEIAAERFRVLHLLGQGGMAQVFAAEDLELGQNVAIKVIRPELAADPRARDLLRREVLLARRVTHRNVCRIFDVFQHSAPAAVSGGLRSPRPEGAARTLVLVMELVRGETLARRLARGGPLPPVEALSIVRQLAEALDAAHRSQVVHGDFKCANIILEPSPAGPRAVVTDFGLAQHAAVTVGCAGGTSAYMSPEQLRGELTLASDIYALGVVVHEMVVGQRPPPARRGPTKIDFRATLTPLSPLLLGHAGLPALPPRWRTALRKCLSPSPQQRPGSALEVARALAAGLPARARLPAGGPRRLLTGIGMLALLVVCLGLVPNPLRSPLPGAAPSPAAAGEPSPRLGSPLGAVDEAGASDEATATPRLAIAIGAFADASPDRPPSRSRPDDSRAWLADALGHLLFAELAAGGQVEAFQVQPAPAAAAAAPIPGDLRVDGSFDLAAGAHPENDEKNGRDAALLVELRLRRAATGELVASFAERGRLAELPALAARLAERVRAILALGALTDQDRAAVLAMHPATVEAEGLYATGASRLLRQRYLEAYGLLTQAVAADPAFALSHAALARVCSALGYDQQAREEALLASTRSHALLQQQRLEIEAISRGLNNDLPGAAGLYRALWDVAPHHSDYGLELAEAQLAAGQSRAALETLRRLRAGRRGGASDLAGAPLLDSLEARARYNLSEFKSALTASLAAQAKARHAGDDFALAEAFIDEANARVVDGNGDANLALAQARSLYRRLGYRVGEAKALKALAKIAENVAAMQRALEIEDRALSIFQAAAATGGAAGVLIDKAINLRKMGQAHAAGLLLDRALAAFRRLGDRQNEALALSKLALVETETGEQPKAEKHFMDAVSLYSELGNPEGLIGALTDLAFLEMGYHNNFTAAKEHHEEALRIAQKSGFKRGEAIGHINVGSVHALEGNLRAARAEFWKALRLAREINDRYLELHALSCYGTLLVDQGNFPLAESAIRQAMALETQTAEMTHLSVSWFDLARLELRAGRFPAAERAARQGMDVQLKLGSKPQELAEGLSFVVMAQAGEGRLEDARRTLDAALQGSAGRQEPTIVLQLALATARLALASQRPIDAVRALQPALQRFADVPDPEHMVEARFLLDTAKLAMGYDSEACPDLRSLAQQLERQGFEYIAHEAGRLLTSAAGCRASSGPRV